MSDDIDKIGMFSVAGIISGETFNLLKSFNKTKITKKNTINKNSYYPDKEWLDFIKGKNRITSNDIIKETKFNIDEIKNQINKNNIYFKEEEKNNKNKTLFKKNKNLKDSLNIINSKKHKKIEILNKKHLYQGKNYKYYNEHIKRLNKYKDEGIYKKLLSQKGNSSYNPNMDYIYKKILSGPKWDKLSGRKSLFKLNRSNINNNSINASTEDNYKNSKKNNTFKLKSGNKSRNISILNKKIKGVNSAKNINFKSLVESGSKSKEKMNQIFSSSNNNNNTNISTNNYINSPLTNLENDRIILTFDLKRNSLSINNNKLLSYNNKLLIIKPNNILQRQSHTNIIKKEYLPGPDFKRYLDLEKLERKKKRLQKVALAKITLCPNYSSIEANPKSFVNYKTKSTILNKKPKIFNGINCSEFLYDPSKTFDKIYGYKMKAVPKFNKMMSRPFHTNLPSFMRGLNSRLGLELNSEKGLKMNNYENGKMYRSQSFFGEKKMSYNKIIKIRYEDDKELNKDKIEKDLDLIKKRFKNIEPYDYT